MVQQFGGGVEQQIGRDFVVASADVDRLDRPINLAVLRNLNQTAARHARRQRRRCRTRTFGNVQWREMTGEGQLQGRRPVVREAVQQRLQLPRVVHRSARANDSGARAPRTPRRARRRTAATSTSWEGPSDFDIRHRFVVNFIAELPFGEASRCCPGRRRRADSRRLAGERHLQRALGPAVHGHAGQQQRRRRA